MKEATPYTSSFPCGVAAAEFGIPLELVFNYAWGIVNNCRGADQTLYTRAAGELVLGLLGVDRTIEFHDKLLATMVDQGVVPFQESAR